MTGVQTCALPICWSHVRLYNSSLNLRSSEAPELLSIRVLTIALTRHLANRNPIVTDIRPSTCTSTVFYTILEPCNHYSWLFSFQLQSSTLGFNCCTSVVIFQRIYSVYPSASGLFSLQNFSIQIPWTLFITINFFFFCFPHSVLSIALIEHIYSVLFQVHFSFFYHFLSESTP